MDKEAFNDSFEKDKYGNIRWTRRGGDLAGAPQKVEGDFICSDCDLVSLEFGPLEVEGSFYCDRNRLVSLHGMPRSFSSFSVGQNPLATLDGAEGESQKYINIPKRWNSSDIDHAVLQSKMDPETREVFGDLLRHL